MEKKIRKEVKFHDIVIDVEITINDDYGWFEFYDVETGGDEMYGEGGLWFEEKQLVDYDGVFELPEFIETELESLGYELM